MQTFLYRLKTWGLVFLALMLLSALVAVARGGLSDILDAGNRAQLSDFKRDVVASGFTLAPEMPGVQNPDFGTGEVKRTVGTTTVTTTGTVMEIKVLVKGCTATLERAKDEVGVEWRGTKGIKLYTLSKVTGRDGKGAKAKLSKKIPTADDVAKFLADNRTAYSYCVKP